MMTDFLIIFGITWGSALLIFTLYTVLGEVNPTRNRDEGLTFLCIVFPPLIAVVLLWKICQMLWKLLQFMYQVIRLVVTGKPNDY